MIDEFIEGRRPRWERLETLLRRARGRGGHRLQAAELEELGRLYRQATSDLAAARRDFPSDRVAVYLEQLVGRAHHTVYRREAGTAVAVRHFFATGFPRAFREAGPYTALAFALLADPFACAAVATLVEPLIGRIILPASPLTDQTERGQSWMEIQEGWRAPMASFIATNNIQVSFLAFAGGVLFGLGTVYVLVNNGLTLGAVAGMATAYGLGDELGGFVAAHGGIELTVVFIAGGAGLRMGHALLAPGLLPRSVALAEAARRSVMLLFGCVPLLMIAGLLEAFVSPTDLPTSIKLVIGGGATLALYAYLLRR